VTREYVERMVPLGGGQGHLWRAAVRRERAPRGLGAALPPCSGDWEEVGIVPMTEQDKADAAQVATVSPEQLARTRQQVELAARQREDRARAAKSAADLTAETLARLEVAQALAKDAAQAPETAERREQLAADAAVRLNDFVIRRTKQAESKIAFAEAQAAADVRAAAADHAARAAEIVLRGEAQGPTGADLVSREIASLKARLN